MNIWPDRIWIAKFLFVAGLAPLAWVLSGWLIQWFRQRVLS